MWRVAIGVVGLVGCSQPDLTCSLLANPSNCFAQAAVALAACMPMRATPATLSTDQTTCTFADGVYVVFNAPLPRLSSHVTDPGGIEFSIYAPDASLCGHLYYEENAGDVLGVSDGTDGATWETPLDSSGFALGCPSHRYTGSPDDGLACQPSTVVPGFVYSTSGPPYSFTVSSVATPSPLFTCQ